MPQNTVTSLRTARDNCGSCRLSNFCLPEGLPENDVEALDSIIQRRKPLTRGSYLFQAGSPFTAIYAVRTGAVKTAALHANGDEHITGFHLPGKVVGLDSLNSRSHASSAMALETTTVCEIPFEPLEALGESLPKLQKQLLRIMSREISGEQKLSQMLAHRSAEQRLASILIAFSESFADRGQSATRFRLPMSRHELGSYLGLTPETMSRIFRRLESQGLLSTHGKEIILTDICGLNRLSEGETAQEGRAQLSS